MKSTEIAWAKKSMERNGGFQSLFRSMAQSQKSAPRRWLAENLQGSAHAVLLATLADKSPEQTFLYIAPDEEGAAYVQNDLSHLATEGQEVYFFPSSYKRAMRYGHKDVAYEVSRTELLELLYNQVAPTFIVTYPEALMEGIVGREAYEQGRMTIKVGDEWDRQQLRAHLWEMGFEEVDYVYLPGQFAVRGSLLDIFSFAHLLPVRIDFFDREVESIRTFEPEDQLSVESLTEAHILASFTVAQEKQVSLLSLLRRETIVMVEQYSFLRTSLQEIYEAPPVHPEDNTFSSLEMLQRAMLTPDRLMADLQPFDWLSKAIPLNEKGWRAWDFAMKPEPLFHKKFDLLSETLLRLQAEGYETAIMSDQESQIRRLESIFEEQGKGVTFSPIMPTLHQGYVDDSAHVAIFTDHSIFERFHGYRLKSDRIKKNRVTLTLKEIQGFEIGDYVVHINHGIATFGGLVTMEQNGRMQETVRLNFKGGDSVYVSIHSLHHISKYKSKDNEEPPQLSKLGSGAWDRLKERTKKKVKDIARDLIKLYAERLKVKGFAYSPDSYLQQELEASFMYEDTPDQEQATAEVKADMERAVPMDRLICGDVGFGKTEVAIRAAFKAVADSKQVAVLVPTTVLAYQHYRTFSKRLKDFPCRVEYLSQAKGTKERKQILEDLKLGKIDIIIGTHILAGKNIEYKDLGLLIIDEEQKFGVTTKERLRKYRTDIDTLTLSATPIPRTLQFSLMGARDLSNILTPPPNRYPIRTEHTVYDEEVIAEVINAELARDGQIFFIHNRVQNIERVADDIRKAVPGVRIGIGHGQMPPKELEQVILGFVDHQFDILLATTIVENGIDVPNANTIIINGAHRFGLSDLHQLRGRVGRGDRKAYCLLLTPPLEHLTNNAKRRLQSITTFSELGSGYHIAMQDLDIRGAGNLLGAEQSGFVADLGYETYKRVLEEAVAELKEEEFSHLEVATSSETDQPADPAEINELPERVFVHETNIDTDIEAYLPQTYVPGDDERISLYRELDNIKREKDIMQFRQRLEDRFGQLTTEAEELLQVVYLRLLAKRAGVERIILKQGLFKLFLVSNQESAYYRSRVFETIMDNVTRWGRGITVKEDKGKPTISIQNIHSVSDAFAALTRLTSTRTL